MFEFIPKNSSSEEAFEIIDEFYDGWFSSRGAQKFQKVHGLDRPSASKGLTFNDVLNYFPNADTFDHTTLFAGMLWMYYNYPMDYLYKKNKNIHGDTLYRRANLLRIACFLKAAGIPNYDEILYNLSESALQGEYPLYKEGELSLDYDVDSVINTYDFDSNIAEDVIVNRYVNHPLGRATRGGKSVPLALLKKRVNTEIIFTKQAIAIDNELVPMLLLALGKWEGLQHPIEEKVSSEKSAKRDERGHLLDQIPSSFKLSGSPIMKRHELLSIDVMVGLKPSGAVSEKELKHKVTRKQFVPYHEELGFDIDPFVIAQKISDISSDEEFFVLTDSSPRSDFSTESFLEDEYIEL